MDQFDRTSPRSPPGAPSDAAQGLVSPAALVRVNVPTTVR